MVATQLKGPAKLESLQIVRALAAFMVVFHHSQATALMISKVDWPQMVWGAAGVDVFFVISGFIMVYVSENRRARPLRFMYDRVVRIMPNYWLATGVAVALALTATFWPYPIKPSYVLNSAFLIPELRPGTTGDYSPLVFPGWSLRFEFYFYAIFSLALLLHRSRIAVATLLLMLTQYLFFLVQKDAQIAKELIKHNFIVIEFVFGMLIADIHLRYGDKISEFIRKFSLWIIAPASILLIAGAFGLLILEDFRLFPQGTAHLRPFTWGIPSALIVVIMLYMLPPLMEGRWARRAFKPIVMMGDASYSVYLYHIFVIPYVSRMGFARPFDGMTSYFVHIGTIFVITAILSWIIFKVFEAPSGRLLKRLWPRGSAERSAGSQRHAPLSAENA